MERGVIWVEIFYFENIWKRYNSFFILYFYSKNWWKILVFILYFILYNQYVWRITTTIFSVSCIRRIWKRHDLVWWLWQLCDSESSISSTDSPGNISTRYDSSLWCMMFLKWVWQDLTDHDSLTSWASITSCHGYKNITTWKDCDSTCGWWRYSEWGYQSSHPHNAPW